MKLLSAREFLNKSIKGEVSEKLKSKGYTYRFLHDDVLDLMESYSNYVIEHQKQE